MHINENYPILQSMLTSDDKMERYWVNQCLDALVDKNLYKEKYLDRLEEEADIKREQEALAEEAQEDKLENEIKIDIDF